jgi:hypothetical protein
MGHGIHWEDIAEDISVNGVSLSSRIGYMGGRYFSGIKPPPIPGRLTLSVAFQEPSGNAALDAGETGHFLVRVTNQGPGTAHGVSLRLRALEGGEGVILPEPMRVGGISLWERSPGTG